MGTVIARAAQIAMSTTHQGNELSANTATRSPGWMPRATSAAERWRTSPRMVSQSTWVHLPNFLWVAASCLGVRAARSWRRCSSVPPVGAGLAT